MPDTGITDAVTVFNSSLWDTYVRKQVVAQVTSGTIPAAATNGRLYANTSDSEIQLDTGAAIQTLIGWISRTYTPTITASTTNPTGWTTSGRYARVGPFGYAEGTATYGAGTAPVGFLRFGLPSALPARAAGWIIGSIECNDSGTAYSRRAYLPATTYITGYTEAGAFISATSPFTPAAGDYFSWSCLYLVA